MSKLEEKSKLKTGQLIALIAIAALNILWLVCRLISFSGTIKLQTVAPIVMLIITAIYAIYGYKKPHGNHMRYLLLINTVYVGILLIAEQSMQSTYVRAVNIPIIILSTYMAGRLDRYKQNLIISIVVLLLQIANIYPFINRYIQENTLSFVTFFKSVGPVSVWLAVAAGYIFRFKPHKEAGLVDKN